jgi:four helix bundle protein
MFLRPHPRGSCHESREDAAKEVSMTTTASLPGTRGPATAADPQMEYQRFDVYRVALEFHALVPRLFPKRGYAALRDQLDRASASILLNVAEGAGRFARADKAQFYLIARGSAMESAAVLDILLSRGVIFPAVHRHSHGLLIRVTQMLTRLIHRMQR